MNKEDKLKEVLKFLSSPQYQIRWSNENNQINAKKFFDFEVSEEFREEGFSKCIEVDNVDEAFFILENTTVNIDYEILREGLNERIKKAGVDERKSFYIIYKGNLEERHASKKG